MVNKEHPLVSYAVQIFHASIQSRNSQVNLSSLPVSDEFRQALSDVIGREHKKFTSINYDSTYINIVYNMKIKSRIDWFGDVIARTREEAINKAYMAYCVDTIRWKAFNNNINKIYSKDDLIFKCSQNTDSTRKDNLKKFILHNNNAGFAYRDPFSVGALLPDFKVTQEEVAIQTALGNLVDLIKSSPIKLDEDALTFTNLTKADIGTSIQQAISGWGKK